ncbi:MAG TPA: hypothetical protein DHS36_00670 [Candidatus Veblenbacteria bacterium]|uniref:Transcriptional regulator n=4 Tax=Candidatus Vebleniibacteriota TaxID=1817921 RepID=A0A1G2Q8M1_9BACT|nr:MAG: hypothetical protein UV69_C0046G0006 [Parcubacteria group bacterium GW2011_GWE2_43_12]KKT11945.1 MAG: hypothetical protein UV92_C0038G0007 [Parcubacteria group bacterium GW2011_GWA1_43_27]KKT22547.1 MAG: hypothetical protein UW06_C0008G0008 [Parcubacteria group bacterium GW2011_GWE1_43_8]OHA54740.1 MAG: hypothetical protein A2388_00655 [Candidatus Veblenbacteria bacterium RIFOXYB1_FULL_43_13]OHA54967.1 MAG: hypothetical protein A2226_00035 [Candidatus Veblenbacteria bacterium RIFOXYA2_F
MDNQSCDPKAIQDQLNRTEGQVLSLKKMYDDGRRCDELLQQIIAARASLSRLGTMLLEAEAQGCLGQTDSPRFKDLEKTVAQLFKIT